MMLRFVEFGQQANRLCGSLFPLCLRAPHLPLADSYRMVLRNLLSLCLHSRQQNYGLNGIPFVPQKFRNFPAILEHRKIQANPL